MNSVLYDWIYDLIGMNQGGPISPNLIEFLNAECGITLSAETVLLHLLWVDDLILVADSLEALQKQLDGLYD